MLRLFAIAVLCALAFTLNLGAQGRGGPHRGGVSPRTGAVIATGRPAPVVVGRPGFIVGRPGFNGPRRVRAPFVIQQAPFYQPFFWPSPIYPAPVYSASPYIAAPYYSVQEPAPSNSNQVNELRYEVERLTREVQRLREEQQLRDIRQPQPAPPPSTETPSVPVILVFRDGHQIEVQGYAIVGQTLWSLTEQTSTSLVKYEPEPIRKGKSGATPLFENLARAWGTGR